MAKAVGAQGPLPFRIRSHCKPGCLRGSLLHQAQKVFGVLVTILGLDRVTPGGGFTR
jgi:hypothetical protein